MEQDAFNLTTSQAATTVAGSVLDDTDYKSRYEKNSSVHGDGHSDGGMSRVSTYTYASEDAERFRKQVRGRSFNVLNDTYCLPTDDEEWTRLNKQHVAIVLGLGGLYPAPDTVNAILAPEPGTVKRILDLGCGTGVWALAMAERFPHCEVIGIDLAPVPIDADTVPSNCRFEIDDINLGLAHYQDHFDLVHARVISAGFKDFKKAKQDIERCLKPGGMVVWIDGDYHFSGEDPETYVPLASEVNPEGSWMARIIWEMRRCAVKVGRSDLFTMAEELQGGLWRDPLIDPETCGAGSLYLPIGPWASHPDVHQSQRLKLIGTLIRQDALNVATALRPLLLNAGYREETFNEWVKLIHEELNTTKRPLWVRFLLAWGRRRNDTDEPLPPLPDSVPPSDNSDNNEDGTPPPPPYPYLFTYNTEQEALQAQARLNQSLRPDQDPPPGPPTPPLTP
ncbi:S-adenosyl-L-methionine-dependent methyltransferase [Serendipita vermifera]|nr:S-adenosyl-L-methionine-dependent methyltransferase [Serendipita vermifera]